jgi:type II secretory ATPase GspE/PulE/Tfp pilus assembly ATPase PilB-like protein
VIVISSNEIGLKQLKKFRPETMATNKNIYKANTSSDSKGSGKSGNVDVSAVIDENDSSQRTLAMKAHLEKIYKVWYIVVRYISIYKRSIPLL